MWDINMRYLFMILILFGCSFFEKPTSEPIRVEIKILNSTTNFYHSKKNVLCVEFKVKNTSKNKMVIFGKGFIENIEIHKVYIPHLLELKFDRFAQELFNEYTFKKCREDWGYYNAKGKYIGRRDSLEKAVYVYHLKEELKNKSLVYGDSVGILYYDPPVLLAPNEEFVLQNSYTSVYNLKGRASIQLHYKTKKEKKYYKDGLKRMGFILDHMREYKMLIEDDIISNKIYFNSY